jgi:hypothetical protein
VDTVCDASGAKLAVEVCDLVPELTVLVVEFADAFVCEGEASQVSCTPRYV